MGSGVQPCESRDTPYLRGGGQGRLPDVQPLPHDRARVSQSDASRGAARLGCKAGSSMNWQHSHSCREGVLSVFRGRLSRLSTSTAAGNHQMMDKLRCRQTPPSGGRNGAADSGRDLQSRHVSLPAAPPSNAAAWDGGRRCSVTLYTILETPTCQWLSLLHALRRCAVSLLI